MSHFVGFSVPVQDSLLKTLQKVRLTMEKRELFVKWVSTENFHVTLKFLGILTQEDEERAHSIVKEVTQRCGPFTLRLRNLGAFPSEQRARVLWIGTNLPGPLLSLQELIEESFATHGFCKEEKEFHPHVTIGRTRNFHSVRSLIAPFARKEFYSFPVEHLTLFRSEQENFFPTYIPVASEPFTVANE